MCNLCWSTSQVQNNQCYCGIPIYPKHATFFCYLQSLKKFCNIEKIIHMIFLNPLAAAVT